MGPRVALCGSLLTIGLVWGTLAYLDGRENDYVERLLGALQFFDETIKSSREFDAKLHTPSIQPQSEPGHWALSGIMFTRDGVVGRPRIRTDYGNASAILENICPDSVDPACWRLKKLAVDGQAIDISELVNPYHPSTLDDGSRTPALQSIAASPPLENVTVPVHGSLQCVEQVAWRDPDIGRNKQFIIDEEICLKVIEFAENDVKWRVQVLDSGRPGNNWIVLHDDEDSAFDSALYAIVRYGGKVIDVDLQLSTLPVAIVDPNHNFAVTNDHGARCGGPFQIAAPVFTSTIIEQLGAPPFLALHNNYDGHFRTGGSGNISVGQNAQGLFGMPAYDAVGRLADEDNFVLVSGITPPDRIKGRVLQLTDDLRNSGINVIYEYVRESTYDCSLSNYLLLYGGAEPGQYFNIEAEAGDYQSQISMIDAVVGMLLNPSLVSR